MLFFFQKTRAQCDVRPMILRPVPYVHVRPRIRAKKLPAAYGYAVRRVVRYYGTVLVVNLIIMLDSLTSMVWK